MAVASKPMNEANANDSAIPADPVIPPTRMFPGAKEAPRSMPSGPPPRTRTTTEVSSSDPSSSTISTPSSLAPTSTLNADSASTRAQASSDQIHQDRSRSKDDRIRS